MNGTAKEPETPEKDTDTTETTEKTWKQRFGQLRRDWKKTTLGNKVIAGSATVTAGATLIYCVVACFQLVAIHNANVFNRESLQAVQRAFVNYGGIGFQRDIPPVGSGIQATWAFFVMIENSGTTPAIDVISSFESSAQTSEPTEAMFLSAATSTPTTIGPKANKTVGTNYKPDSFVFGKDFDPEIFERSAHDYGKAPVFWSWTVYRDVFPNTKPHLAEYCEYLSRVAYDYTPPPSNPKFSITRSSCSEHNCADEQCKDYDKVVALAYRAKK